MGRTLTVILLTSIILGVALGIIMLNVARLRTGSSTLEPPRELAGYKLVSSVSGEEAVARISKMHMFSEEVGKIVDGVIAIYAGEGGVAHLWISVAPSASEAERLTKLMMVEMSKGDTPYTPPKLITLNGISVYYGTGSNMYYYFFYKGRLVVWVSITGEDQLRVAFLKELIDRI